MGFLKEVICRRLLSKNFIFKAVITGLKKVTQDTTVYSVPVEGAQVGAWGQDRCREASERCLCPGALALALG